jgi:hypothetical protein
MLVKCSAAERISLLANATSSFVPVTIKTGSSPLAEMPQNFFFVVVVATDK